jgi:hypothetical protein
MENLTTATDQQEVEHSNAAILTAQSRNTPIDRGLQGKNEVLDKVK